MWRIPLLCLSLSIVCSQCGPIPSSSSEYISLIEKEASKLTDDSLGDDDLLTQHVIAQPKTTIYTRQSHEKHGALVFKREGSDEGKPVVVLNEGEDFLNTCGKKSTFVVLKQSGGDKKNYRVFFAYVKYVF
jgi:hypothetical protein